MDVIYAGEEPPLAYSKSVFLVGPTPRDKNVSSWRPTMLSCLELEHYDGVVFVPELRDPACHMDNEKFYSWCETHLKMSDLIIYWSPD